MVDREVLQMSGHPKHGIKPESEKIRQRASWGSSQTRIFKLLARTPGTKIWKLLKIDFDLRRAEREAKSKGLETLLQDL